MYNSCYKYLGGMHAISSNAEPATTCIVCKMECLNVADLIAYNQVVNGFSIRPTTKFLEN